MRPVTQELNHPKIGLTRYGMGRPRNYETHIVRVNIRSYLLTLTGKERKGLNSEHYCRFPLKKNLSNLCESDSDFYDNLSFYVLN